MTYSSGDSFENRFGRKPQPPLPAVNALSSAVLTPLESPKPLPANDLISPAANSEGHPNTVSRSSSLSLVPTLLPFLPSPPPHLPREPHPNNPSFVKTCDQCARSSASRIRLRNPRGIGINKFGVHTKLQCKPDRNALLQKCATERTSWKRKCIK